MHGVGVFVRQWQKRALQLARWSSGFEIMLIWSLHYWYVSPLCPVRFLMISIPDSYGIIEQDLTPVPWLRKIRGQFGI